MKGHKVIRGDSIMWHQKMQAANTKQVEHKTGVSHAAMGLGLGFWLNALQVHGDRYLWLSGAASIKNQEEEGVGVGDAMFLSRLANGLLRSMDIERGTV